MNTGININAPLQAPPASALPGPYALDQLQLEQRQALANALMGSSLQQVQPQPSGRLVAKVSPFQVLGQLGTAALGAKVQNDVTRGTLDLGQRWRQAQDDAALGAIMGPDAGQY